MAVLHAIAFATFFLKNNHFVALNKSFFDFANHFGSLNGGNAYLNCAVCIDEQHTVELNSLAVFGIVKVMNIQKSACFSLELLSLNFYDNVHCLL